MAVPTLGYWDIRGLAQPIRLLLNYAGQEFKEDLYEINNQTEWFENKKFNLGLDFPNLPYYFDGQVKLTQSTAIIRHIARKHNLAGTTEEEKTRVDLLLSQIEDIRNKYYTLVYDPSYEKLKEAYLKSLEENLTLLVKFLGKNKFFAGKNVTYVDFIVYEFLQQNKIIKADYLDQFPALKKFEEAIETLPKISNFLKTTPTLKWQFQGSEAVHGNKYIPY